MLTKSPEADLRQSYGLIVRKATVLTLASAILVFLTYTRMPVTAYEMAKKQVLIEVENIPKTVQHERPPAPARPSIPIESDAEDLPEDATIAETELDFDAFVEVPPEPPALPAEEPEVFVAFDVPPKPILVVRPKYPELARKAGVEGDVLLFITVDEQGKVLAAEVIKSLGKTGLDEAAIEAALKCKFTPAYQRDRPVRVKVAYLVKFRLKDAEQ